MISDANYKIRDSDNNDENTCDFYQFHYHYRYQISL